MKKIIMLGLTTILFAIPMFAFAKVTTFEKPDLNGSDAIIESEEGKPTTKTAPLYAKPTSSTDPVTEAEIRIKPNKDNNSEVTAITCTASSPYEVKVSKDGEYTVCTFTANSDQAIKGSKVQVGKLTVTIPEEASNCDITIGVPSKDPAKTGAELDYLIIAAGLAGIGVLYFSTRSNRKIHNI